MNFVSLAYLLFLPAVFCCYWLLCPTSRAKNVLVVIASYVFYGWWDERFVLLLAFTTLCSYASGLLIGRGRGAKAVLWANVLVNLGILGVFKYYDFFAESVQELCAALDMPAPGWPLLHVVLPVGISFYTFQALSYSIDVYRGRLAPTRDVVAFSAYLCFFPQLVAGPIERASHLLPQFQRVRTFGYSQAVDGMRQMLWGFFKKIVIADGCAEGVNSIFGDYAHLDGTTLLMGAFLFSIQIYGDFSGYSDIAIGTARLFGIELVQNFRTPYFARSVGEFWRRWHISLMTWLRDYVYIPLGGSRRGRLLRLRNTLVVFLVSGLWHGAAWTFVCWGLYHALWVMVSPARSSRAVCGRFSSALGVLSTFLVVMAGWVLFRSPSLADAAAYFTGIATRLAPVLPAYGKTMLPLIALLFIAEWGTRHRRHVLDFRPGYLSPALRIAVYYALGIAIFLFGGQDTPFIYFQF